MPLFGLSRGTPQGQMRAILGDPAVVNLTTSLSGNTQNSFIAPTDYCIVNTADGTNKSLTIPDPNKYGGTPGDQFIFFNANSGQTLNIFPPTGGNIDNAGANTAATVANNASIMIVLVSYTASTSVWFADSGT